jgi:hypothetical protein
MINGLVRLLDRFTLRPPECCKVSMWSVNRVKLYFSGRNPLFSKLPLYFFSDRMVSTNANISSALEEPFEIK